jgi:hypothetical protein
MDQYRFSRLGCREMQLSKISSAGLGDGRGVGATGPAPVPKKKKRRQEFKGGEKKKRNKRRGKRLLGRRKSGTKITIPMHRTETKGCQVRTELLAPSRENLDLIPSHPIAKGECDGTLLAVVAIIGELLVGDTPDRRGADGGSGFIIGPC